MSFFTREIKTETVAIRSFQSLDDINLKGDLFKALYQNSFELPDASILLGEIQSVDRSVEIAKGETVDFNGTQYSLTDLIAIAALFAEKWRQQDDDAKVADAGGLGGVGVVTPP